VLRHSTAYLKLSAQAKALDQQIAQEGASSLGALAGIPIAIKVITCFFATLIKTELIVC